MVARPRIITIGKIRIYDKIKNIRKLLEHMEHLPLFRSIVLLEEDFLLRFIKDGGEILWKLKRKHADRKVLSC